MTERCSVCWCVPETPRLIERLVSLHGHGVDRDGKPYPFTKGAPIFDQFCRCPCHTPQ